MQDLYYEKDNLQSALKNRIDSVELNKIISAFEMADRAYGDDKSEDGTPLFFHTTRVCRILVEELGVIDSDIISAALLHFIYADSEEITNEIIDHNFGPYTAYLVDLLNTKFDDIEKLPDSIPLENINKVRIPKDDYLMVWMTEHLDYMRHMDYSDITNPVKYVTDIMNKYMPVAKKSENKKVQYLIVELTKEKNKLFG